MQITIAIPTGAKMVKVVRQGVICYRWPINHRKKLNKLMFDIDALVWDICNNRCNFEIVATSQTPLTYKLNIFINFVSGIVDTTKQEYSDKIAALATTHFKSAKLYKD